jgi:Putative transposase
MARRRARASSGTADSLGRAGRPATRPRESHAVTPAAEGEDSGSTRVDLRGPTANPGHRSSDHHAARARREAPGDPSCIRRRTLGAGATAVGRRGVPRVTALRGCWPTASEGRDVAGAATKCWWRSRASCAACVRRAGAADVRLRQWVRSVPYELRRVLAADPAMLTLTSRVFFEELRRGYREASGLGRSDELKIEAGAITFVHLGSWFAQFSRAFSCHRSRRCLALRDGRAPEAGEATGEAVDEARFGRRPPKAKVGGLEGFNLHASVVIGATDHEGRERMLRYVARPRVASGRVSELADGRVAWLLKAPGGREQTHRIMELMEFMARLSALVPPRRFPWVRYHGVFAPNYPWRIAVVPLRSASVGVKACATSAARARDGKDATETPAIGTATTTAPVEATGDDGWMWTRTALRRRRQSAPRGEWMGPR